MDDAEAYRRESRRGWGSVAGGWGRHAAAQTRAAMAVTTWMLDAARLQPGSSVLDLAAGPGEVGFLAYELVQPGGTLITSDFAPEMLTEAQRRAEALGLDGVRFKQIDAESIDLETASLDAVLCRWGFMLMADPGAALRECRRVLRPGGRLALAAWTGPEDNRWSSALWEILVRRGLVEPPPPGRPGQFAWARPGLIEVEALDFAYREGFDEWWERSREISPSSRVVDGLAPEERDAVRGELRAALGGHEADDGLLELPARTWVAAATA